MRLVELSQKSEYPEISLASEFSIGFPKILAKTEEVKCLASRKETLEKIGIFLKICALMKKKVLGV